MTTTGELTALKILEAGRDLIARRGYSNFSYTDVSGVVGIHKTSIHHHFPAKADLARAVVHHSREIFQRDVAALAADGADALAQLRAYLDGWERGLKLDHEKFCVAAMLGAEVPFLPEEVAEAVAEYFATVIGWFKTLLAAGVATGQFRLAGPVPTEAAELASLVHGALLLARANRDPQHFTLVTAAAVDKLISK